MYAPFHFMLVDPSKCWKTGVRVFIHSYESKMVKTNNLPVKCYVHTKFAFIKVLRAALIGGGRKQVPLNHVGHAHKCTQQEVAPWDNLKLRHVLCLFHRGKVTAWFMHLFGELYGECLCFGALDRSKHEIWKWNSVHELIYKVEQERTCPMGSGWINMYTRCDRVHMQSCAAVLFFARGEKKTSAAVSFVGYYPRKTCKTFIFCLFLFSLFK